MKRGWIILLAAIYCLAAFIVFPLPERGGFVSDDWDWIGAASETHGVLPDVTKNYLRSDSGSSYNPVASLWINVFFSLFGADPIPYHVGSRILYGLTATIVALLMVQALRSFVATARSRRFGIASGFLFLLLPMHAEAVLWIAAIPHLLATFFSAASMLLYLRARERHSVRLLSMSLVSMLIAFFSKEVALIIPVMLGLLEIRYRTHHHTERRLRVMWFYAAAALGIIGFLALRLQATGMLIGTYAEQGVILRPYQWINTLATFFIEFMSLGTARVAWMQWFWSEPRIASLVSVGCIVVLWWFIVRLRRANLLVWWHVLLLSLLPYVTLGFNRLSQEGERYLYLPSVFFLILLGLMARAYVRRFMTVLVVLLIFMTLQPLALRNSAWQKAYAASDAIVQAAVEFDRISQPGHTYLVIGLPDTIGGAHVSRNGLAQAMALQRAEPRARWNLVPVYTQIPAQDATASVLQWTWDERGAFAVNPDRRYVVTGNDRRETEYFTYELWNYEYATFSSDTIRLLYTDALRKGLADGTVSLVTWNGSTLVDVGGPSL